MSRPATLARRHDARVVAALGLVLVVVAVILVPRGGDDHDRVEIDRGTPAFPLRGELARDDRLLAEAADAWIRDDRRNDEEDRVFDDDRDVGVLWAGKLGDTRTVVAAHERTAAVLRRRNSQDPDLGRQHDRPVAARRRAGRHRVRRGRAAARGRRRHLPSRHRAAAGARRS